MAQQSLYRRYRPRRFGDLKGQDHVVLALRTAVAEGREGQAYLFSGPRGTGKTTSARILAKVLNCERPLEGEPCCECTSCLAVEAGTSFDVIELDAASHNKVDDIRELIERVNLGTPGRHKVYILDEVHMLSPGAEAALLKTLEEPPPHVVFVLATTDPQKVRETIRSRTQHLAFHLLAEKDLEAHVRWVAQDAGIPLSEDALNAVLRQAAGSARDALSALELVASGGGLAVEAVQFDEFVEALIEADPGRALAAVAFVTQQGRDARNIAENVLAHLRDCFLSLMAPELVQLPETRRDAVARQAERLGAAAAVRAMETIGEALVDMRHAPDPRVLLEVSLVKLTSPKVSGDFAALAARVERLEQTAAKGGGGTAGAPSASSASSSPGATAGGRAVLGARARTAPAPEPEPQRAPTAPEPAAAAAPPAAPAPSPAAPRPSAPSGDAADVFETTVKANLRGAAKAVYLVAQPSVRDGVLVLAFPSEGHAKRAAELQPQIEQAMAAAGAPVRIVVEASPDAAPPPQASLLEDEPIDPAELVDAPGEAVSTVSRITAAFPGSQLIQEEG